VVRRSAGLRGQPWIDQIFQAQAARNGAVIRRKISSVAQFASHDLLEAEVRSRGFHMITCGDQYVIICNPGQLQVIC
jgi:hypothetical protein